MEDCVGVGGEVLSAVGGLVVEGRMVMVFKDSILDAGLRNKEVTLQQQRHLWLPFYVSTQQILTQDGHY